MSCLNLPCKLEQDFVLISGNELLLFKRFKQSLQLGLRDVACADHSFHNQIGIRGFHGRPFHRKKRLSIPYSG